MQMSGLDADVPALNITPLYNAEQLEALRQQTSSRPEVFIPHLVSCLRGANTGLSVLQGRLGLDNSASPLPPLMQKEGNVFVFYQVILPPCSTIYAAPPPSVIFINMNKQ